MCRLHLPFKLPSVQCECVHCTWTSLLQLPSGQPYECYNLDGLSLSISPSSLSPFSLSLAFSLNVISLTHATDETHGESYYITYINTYIQKVFCQGDFPQAVLNMPVRVQLWPGNSKCTNGMYECLLQMRLLVRQALCETVVISHL